MIMEMVEIAETFLETYPPIGREAVAALMAYKPRDTSGDYGDSLKFIMDCKFTCSTAEELMLERNKIISQMEKKIHVPPARLRILLQHFDWDTRKLLSGYSPNNPVESIKSLYEQAGIPAEDTSTLDLRISQMSHMSHECPSCLEDFQLSEMVALNCNHLYCLQCVRDYATLQINEGKADCINCPGYKCKYIMDEIMISSLVDNENYEKYVKFLSNAFIEKHPQIKWCPAKGCGLAIRKQGAQSGMVMCKCGFIWCWKCLRDGHWPSSCAQIKWWNDVYAKDEKLSFDSAEEALSVRWLLQYTQDCPNCSSPIQKNGGCNHMSCKKCGHQYCWVCLEIWQSSHYSCSNSNPQNEDDRRSIISRIESNLTFRQYYLINLRARQGNDRNAKNLMIHLIQVLIREKPDLVDDLAIDTICRAVEFNYLTRHIILNICVLGKYMQEKLIKGSKLLKPELKRLAASISFLHGCIEVPWKQFKISDVELAITGIKTAIKAFIRMFGVFIQQVKPKLDEAALLSKEKKI